MSKLADFHGDCNIFLQRMAQFHQIGETVKILTNGHTDDVLCVCVDCNSELIASGYVNGNLCLW